MKKPRYIFRIVNKKYKITNKVICDIGCGYGEILPLCQPDSYGINYNDYQIKKARSLGLTIYDRDINNDSLNDLPKVDAIWCSAVLEHLDSPHLSLCRFHGLLKKRGLLFVYVPTIPLFLQLRHVPYLGKYFYGHIAKDHKNAFTPATLQFTCERAGFETLEASPFYPLSLLNYIPVLNEIIDGCVYVGMKR